MRHKGNTPAIYANTRKAFLVQPGETVPSRHATFIVGHRDLTCLAIAYDKSTFGERDGSRSIAGRTYMKTAREVLARVVSRRIEPVTEAEFHILLHALGWPSETLGWRNHYNGDNPLLAGLVERGLLEQVPMPIWPGNTYRVTSRGKFVAGVQEEPR